jgi:phosphatidylglycerol lysyltransferase
VKLRNVPWRKLGLPVSLAIFLAALWFLDRELQHVRYHEIVKDLEAIPWHRLLLSVLLTAGSYLMLIGYDLLGLRYAGRSLSFGRVAMASFVGNSFSHTLGFLAATPLRFRIYTAWGLTPSEITKLVGFSAATFWLGHLTLSGLSLTVASQEPNVLWYLNVAWFLPAGILLLLLTATYIILTFTRRTPLKIVRWEVKVPESGLAARQLVVACSDWLMAGAALYVLLPDQALSFASFFVLFMLSHVVGIISGVPGEAGVFDSAMVVALSAEIGASPVIGALIAYRAVYYLFPLSVSALLLAIQEIARLRERFELLRRTSQQIVNAVVPHLFAYLCFVGGAVLIFSGATPAVHSRLALLDRLVPLPLLELSHFLGSVAGVGLLLIARGLQRRLDAAYYVTVGLLILGVAVSLLKGLDYEEATVLSVMLLALLPCHSAFYRKSYLLDESLSPGWIAAIVVVLGASIWIGFFSYRRVEYSQELWWQFTLRGDAPRFLRATLGAMLVALWFGAARLLRPAPPPPNRPTADDLARAAEITRNSPRTTGYLALLGDKSLLFNPARTAFVMYGIEGRSWVAMSDPVGNDSQREELAWMFVERSRRSGGWPVFYQVEAQRLAMYVDLGLRFVKLGEEAVVHLDSFGLEGREVKNLRHSYAHAAEGGLSLEIVEQNDVPRILPELRAVSDVWLAERKTREKGFSLGRFNEDYLRHFPIAAVHQAGRMVGFANLWLTAGKQEMSVDLMRHDPTAAGVMDYLFVELMLWGKREGYRTFALGMSPLAGLESRALAPLWARLGALLFEHGETFYNFQGLHNFKSKFKPEWQPRFLAAPGGIALPVVAVNIAALIAGGWKGVIGK